MLRSFFSSNPISFSFSFPHSLTLSFTLLLSLSLLSHTLSHSLSLQCDVFHFGYHFGIFVFIFFGSYPSDQQELHRQPPVSLSLSLSLSHLFKFLFSPDSQFISQTQHWRIDIYGKQYLEPLCDVLHSFWMGLFWVPHFGVSPSHPPDISTYSLPLLPTDT